MISEEYDNKLFVVDILNKSICTGFHCPLGWANYYEFFNDRVRLHFDKESIDYTFYGECLEPKKLPVKKENPFDTFYYLESKYDSISEKSSRTDIEYFYREYLKISKEQLTPYTYGCVFKRLGELSLLLENKKDALTFFEKATELYPGIGVKKKISTLKKELI